MAKSCRPAHLLRIAVRSSAARRGTLLAGSNAFPCALGRSGSRILKREGDGGTPIGTWTLRKIYYRPDRTPRPRTGLPLAALRPSDGWCDAPGDRNYNRAVSLPYPASCERLWRDDNLYDLIVVLSHNERPRMRNGGSAIFIHVARPDYTPTEGCIALSRRHLARLLARCGRTTCIRIGA